MRRTRPPTSSVADIWSAHAGAVGVETSVPVLLTLGVATGRLTLERFVEVASAAPARVWGLRGKGRLEIGADADLTLLALDRELVIDESRLHGRSTLSPFRGAPVRGMPVATIVRGRIVMRDGQAVGPPDPRPVSWTRGPPSGLTCTLSVRQRRATRARRPRSGRPSAASAPCPQPHEGAARPSVTPAKRYSADTVPADVHLETHGIEHRCLDRERPGPPAPRCPRRPPGCGWPCGGPSSGRGSRHAARRA